MLAMYGMKNGSGPRMDSLMNTSRYTSIMEGVDRRYGVEGSVLSRRAELDLMAHRRRMNEITAGFSGDFHRAHSLLSKRKFESGHESENRYDGESVLKKAKSHFGLPQVKRTLKPIPPLLSYSKRDKTFTEVCPGTSAVLDKDKTDHKNGGRQLYIHTNKLDILKRADEPSSSYVSKHIRHPSEEMAFKQLSEGDRNNDERKTSDRPSEPKGYNVNPQHHRKTAKRIDFKSVSSLLNSDKEDDDISSRAREISPEKTEEKRSAFREVTKRGPLSDSVRADHNDFGEFDGREKQLSPTGPVYNFSSYKQPALSQFSRRFSDPLNCTTERGTITTNRHLSPTSLAQAPLISARRDICVETLGKSVSPVLLDVPSPTGTRAFRRTPIHSDLLSASKSAFSPPSQSAEHPRAGVMDYLQKTSPVPKTAFPQAASTNPHYYDSIRTAFKNFSDMNSKSSRGLLPGMLPNNAPEPNRFNSVPLPPPPTEVGALSSYSGYPRLYDGDIAASAIPYPAVQKSSPSQAVMPLSSTVFNFAQNWCAKCNASFRMTSDLVYHMRTHHKRDVIDVHKRKREEKLRCDICGETFRERHHLSRHMTSHNG